MTQYDRVNIEHVWGTSAQGDNFTNGSGGEERRGEKKGREGGAGFK